MSNPPESINPDAPIVEGLTGRLPFLVGGIAFFFSLSMMMRLRNLLQPNTLVIDFDKVVVWGIVAVIVALIITPLIHQAGHALVALSLRSGIVVHRRWIFPRVRPATPLSRSGAVWFLLAPLLLTLLSLPLLALATVGAAVALFNAVNLALSVNDLWKALGLLRFGRNVQVQLNTDHCRVLQR